LRARAGVNPPAQRALHDMTCDILRIQLQFRIQPQFSVDPSPSEPEEAPMRNLIRALIAALSLVALPVVSQAGLFVGVSVNIAPPVLPVYVQPPCPAPGYIWIPGYWAWDDGYYWVPGTWMLAPEVGLLWTPGYWGWAEGAYVWHVGYWGPRVGFYGGVNYGFGYDGVGYEGGYWRGNQFYYNRSVTNINTTNITNVYNRTVVNNVNVTRVSYNGGAGGVVARPTAAELSAEHERRMGPTSVQRGQQQMASTDHSLRAAANGGRPAIAATPKAGVFSGHGVVAARGAEHAPPLHESATDQASAPQHYASVQHGAGAQYPGRTEPQYQGRPEPQHQARPEPQHQGRPEPRYQPAPPPHEQARPEPHYSAPPAPHYAPAAPQAPHYQPGPAPQGASHQAPRPEHGGGQDRPGEHNGHG
jgi:hypothetical protein